MKTNTRAIIIDTASSLFYKKGYNLTGINEIIAEAGIAKATLYHHFKSKEDLLMAYLDQLDTEASKKLSDFTSKKPKGDARLIAIIEFLLPFFHQKDFNGCWSIRTMAEIPTDNIQVRQKILNNKKNLQQSINDLIAQNRGDLSKESREMLTRKIYLLYEGALTESHIQMDDWPIHDAIEILKSLLSSRYANGMK